jgi:hypothetical protein
MGMALLREMPTPCAAGLCRARHPVGRWRVERPAAAAISLHLVRQQGCDDSASRLGWQLRGFPAVSQLSQRLDSRGLIFYYLAHVVG